MSQSSPQPSPLKPAVIGKDGRSSALIQSLERSPRVGAGGVVLLSEWKESTPAEAIAATLERARVERPDWVIVGPEAPLAAGVVDALQNKLGIPCVGPTQALAQLEASKAFTRDLVRDSGIPGNPEYRVFHSLEGLEAYLHKLEAQGGYVVKPDGLTGGKGVKVSGPHLASVAEGLAYARELLAAAPGVPVVIEEKLDGEEFSLMSFCDGVSVADMVPVQDHKRAHPGDTGPNTGGMGSYSCADGLLPFLSPEHLAAASAINRAMPEALFRQTGQRYKGILYGGFMITRRGVRLLEYNARFGDPETMNVLGTLETDLTEVLEAILHGTLAQLEVRWKRQATVCKYLVPEGYPDAPVRGQVVDFSAVPPLSEKLWRCDSALRREGEHFVLTGSRTVAFLGIGDDLAEAERLAESAASAVKGPVFHRPDIGTPELLARRVAHVRALTGA